MMRMPQKPGAKPQVFACLSSRRRWAVLRVLRDRDGPLPVGDLAGRIVADRAGEPTGTDPGSSSRDERRLRVSLHHDHLPALDDAGLVEFDSDAGRVGPTDHPAHGDPVVETALDGGADGDADELETAFEALGSPRRFRALEVLVTIDHHLEPRELAMLVAAFEEERSPQSVATDAVERVHASFHHGHLPKLVDAGLVERRDDGRVAYDEAGPIERSCVTDGIDGAVPGGW